MTLRDVFTEGLVGRNPAWVQMLGLCPLLAVSTSVVNATGLAVASAFVLLFSVAVFPFGVLSDLRSRRGLPRRR